MKPLKWARKQFWFMARFAGYFAMNFLWITLVSHLCRLLSRFGHPPFGFIFLVYPGTKNQVRGYAPVWYRNIAPKLSVIGIMRARGGVPWGLVMTISWTIRELREEGRDKYLEKVLLQTEVVAKRIGAKSIALAGILPGVITRNGLQHMLRPPFVTGERGTIYAILLSAKQAANSVGRDLNDLVIGILGYGFIGSRLVELLRNNSVRKIVCVDPVTVTKITNEGHLTLTRDPVALRQCDLVIILTARGDQAETAIAHLRPGTIVIDDTHPQMPSHLSLKVTEKGGRVIKAVLGLNGTDFFPRLPRWESKWLPGCCVEALVCAWSGPADSQSRFNEQADKLGFVALEVSNRSEL